MKKKLIFVVEVSKIQFLKCPLYIWVLLGVYEVLLLLNALIQAPPWEFITSDMGGYIERAQWIAHGIFKEVYLSFYPQGTHYLFAPFFVLFNYFTALHFIAIFQTFCIVIAIYLFYRLIFDLFNSVTVATLTVIGIIIFRTSFSFSSFYLSENVYFLFQNLSLWMIYKICVLDKKFKTSFLFIVGFLSGFTILIRPTILAGYLLIGLFLLIRQKKHLFRKQVILFMLFAMIPGLLQSIYTSVLLKRPSLYTAGGGYELLFGVSGYRTITSETEHGRWVFTNNNYKFDSTIVEEAKFPYPLWEDAGWMQEVNKLWEKDPKKVVKNILRNCRQVWKPITVWPLVWRGHSNVAMFFVPLKLYVWFIYPLALLGLLLAFRRRLFNQIALLIAPVLGLELMCTLRCGEPRYLIPFFWLIIAFAAYGFAIIILEALKKAGKSGFGEVMSFQDKTRILAKYSLISWVLLCLLVPILIWKIATKDPEPTWYWHGELLENKKYVTLTSLNPSKVFSPGGIVKNGKIFGGPLRVFNFVYTSGFFANGDSEIEFKLNRKFDYLETEMGIEQNADYGGEVAFYIWADGILIYPDQKDRELKMHIRRYGETPTHIKLLIRGSKKIMLQTIGGTGGNRWRHRGVWGGPIVSNE